MKKYRTKNIVCDTVIQEKLSTDPVAFDSLLHVVQRVNAAMDVRRCHVQRFELKAKGVLNF